MVRRRLLRAKAQTEGSLILETSTLDNIEEMDCLPDMAEVLDLAKETLSNIAEDTAFANSLALEQPGSEQHDELTVWAQDCFKDVRQDLKTSDLLSLPSNEVSGPEAVLGSDNFSYRNRVIETVTNEGKKDDESRAQHKVISVRFFHVSW